MVSRTLLLLLVLGLGFGVSVRAQEESPTNPSTASPNDTTSPPDHGSKATEPSTQGQVNETVGKMTKLTEEEAMRIAKRVDQDPRAKTAAAGILQPIYAVAEWLAFPTFHWLAFALMSAGVVSFVFQLALGKLIVLLRMGFSLKEIASDAIGLAISVVGLVLTTQAAAENSTFTQSPAAVISAAVVGAVVGIILYFWGQSQELEAAAGRSRIPVTIKKK